MPRVIHVINDLVEIEYKHIKETYWPISESKLSQISQKNLFIDICLFLSSLSITLIVSLLFQKTTYKVEENMFPIEWNILFWVCISTAVSFSIIAGIVYKSRHDLIKNIKESTKEISLEESRIVSEIGIKFDVNQELNNETLRSFLDAYFPDKPKPNEEDIDSLLQELNKYGENFTSLKSKYQKTRDYLDMIEETYYPKGRKFKQHQIVRHIILDLMNDTYWNDRKGRQPKKLIELKEKISKDLKS